MGRFLLNCLILADVFGTLDNMKAFTVFGNIC